MEQTSKHPFHLHGHNFQTIYRSPKDGRPFDTSINPTFPKVPMRRDTILVNANGNAVLRFKADNPGFRESEKRHPIPESHYATCRAARHLYEGNAGGNTENFLDLSNQNVPPPPLAPGFQPRGIVALVFSAIAAVIGLRLLYGTDWMRSREDRYLLPQFDDWMEVNTLHLSPCATEKLHQEREKGGRLTPGWSRSSEIEGRIIETHIIIFIAYYLVKHIKLISFPGNLEVIASAHRI
ncbi:iron transport multicopper oxidase FET3 [Coccidioides posadasii str. Silveira]|uniref:Iron transport multicopper oxidase FET3 n=1 Tax=Coccidioides posadasii (strain RMSCC 757 / Silveira) TaxID=443226 RepID=E9D3X2_COCPS|nr:iron transport multicopper oxidase FET3 [Coccidioides posadasii str. Silveira]